MHIFDESNIIYLIDVLLMKRFTKWLLQLFLFWIPRKSFYAIKISFSHKISYFTKNKAFTYEIKQSKNKHLVFPFIS